MATVVKQSRLPEFESMERRFRRIFEGTPHTVFVPVFLPAADIYETAEEYVVELELPGYKEGELTVEVSDHTLVVAGTREEGKEGTEKAYRLHERLERTFKREFRLPPRTRDGTVRGRHPRGARTEARTDETPGRDLEGLSWRHDSSSGRRPGRYCAVCRSRAMPGPTPPLRQVPLAGEAAYGGTVKMVFAPE